MEPEDIAYNVAYRRLVETCVIDCDGAVLIMDDRRRRKSDNIFKYLRREIPKLGTGRF